MKIANHSFFLGQHFTSVTRDKICLAYALMTGMDINFGTIFKSAMQKVKVHKGRRYAFDDVITELCHLTCVHTEEADYCPHIEVPPYVVTNIKVPEVSTRSVITTIERNFHDELIMAPIFGLEMLRYPRGAPGGCISVPA